MDYAKTFMEGDYRYQAYTSYMAKLQEREHKNLAKIHLSEIRKGTGMMT